jgi:phage tail-like protein
MGIENNSFLHYLPPVLWQETGARPQLLRRILHIFEDSIQSIDKQVDDIPKLFDPWETRSELLPWLASWVALELEAGWSERQSRSLIRNIASIYRQRGTLKGLQKYLRIYVGTNVEIAELPPDEPTTHLFEISIDYHQFYDPHERTRISREIRKIVDREKPAHTHYRITFNHPTMQIGVHSTIGVDTILGTL